MTTGILLLAAGSSKRFVSDKRLSLFQEGRTLLDFTLKNITLSSLPLLVCLRERDTALEEKLSAAQIHCVKCHTASQGMGASLAEGIGKLPGWDGVLIALADMPWIKASTYNAVAAQTQPNSICIPTYQQQRGHPVGFGREFFSQLGGLTGDRGARTVVQDNAAAVMEVSVQDSGILRDVDRPEDILG